MLSQACEHLWLQQFKPMEQAKLASSYLFSENSLSSEKVRTIVHVTLASSKSSRVVPSAQVRSARLAVALFFFTNGALFSSLVPHFPGIKADLGLGNAMYGVAIGAFPGGAIVLGLLAGLLIRKWTSAKVALIFTVATALCIVLVGVSGNFYLLVALLFLGGGGDALTDVGQNAHGLRVQKAYGRSINNGFHAIWSIGAVTGGSIGALMITLGVPRTAHLVAIAVLTTGIALFAYTRRLPGADTEAEVLDLDTQTVVNKQSQRLTVRTMAILGALSLISIAGALVEDAGSTWAAIYLGEHLGAAAGLATTGYIALVGSQFIGRMIGDSLVDRFGQRLVAYAGGFLIFAGMGAALAFPSIPATIVGFGLAGFGSATLIPAAYQTADGLPGLKPGTGLTVVSWLLRLGFLLSPPIVGLVADATSLRLGLLVLPIAGVVILLTASVLENRVQPIAVDAAETASSQDS